MSAQTTSLEDRYIATRDAAIARFTRERLPQIDKAAMDDEARQRGELEKQMRAIIGAVSVPGFSTSKFNLNSLFAGDQDFGKLDGLLFEGDGDSQMIVSTRGLLTRWLRGREQAKLGVDPEIAIRREPFYTHAINTDAAILRFADLNLGVDKTTYAMLGGRTQDAIPAGANEVFVAALRGERFFLINAPFDPPLSIEFCNSAREASEKKIDELASLELKPGRRNDQAMQRLLKMREQVEGDFRRCFAENASKQPAFGEAIKSARDIVSRLPQK